MVGTGIEVTNLRRAEEALRQSEEKYRCILETATEATVIVDAQAQIVFVNDRWSEMFGYSREEAMHMTHFELVFPEDRARMKERWESRQGGRQESYEFRLRRKDVNPIWVLVGVAPNFSLEGEFLGTLTMFADITDRKRAEEALAAAKAAAEAATEAKSRFLARMSHELRTPLNAIVGFSDLMAEGSAGPLNEDYVRFVGHIQRGASYLLELINDILDLSKIEAGRVELRCEELRVAGALAEVLAVINPLAAAKRIEIASALEQDVSVHADRIRFKQILYNLLSNAVKFTPERGRVWIESAPQDGNVRIAGPAFGRH